MDISKLYTFKVKELTALNNTIKAYLYMYKRAIDKPEQDFYRYSIGIAASRINELLEGDTKLNILFRGSLSAKYSRTLRNSNIDIGLDEFNG